MDSIVIEDLIVPCIMGIYAHERITPQPIEAHIELLCPTKHSARSGKISQTIDYAQLTNELAFILQAGQFELLETAAEALASHALFPVNGHVVPERVSVALKKPTAFGGKGQPSVRIFRTKEDMQYICEEDKIFGHVDVVFVSPKLGLYHLNIKPGGTIPRHKHEIMQESEMLLHDSTVSGKKCNKNSIFHWNKGQVHEHHNPSSAYVRVLCIDRPSFIPSDEQVTSDPLDAIHPHVPFLYTP